MVAYKETAEEQLLRMIEGPEGADRSSGSESIHPPEKLNLVHQVWGELKSRLRIWLFLFRSRSQGDPLLWNLRLARRILWVVLAVLGTYAVIDLVVIQPNFKRMRSSAVGSSEVRTVQAVVPVEVKSPLKSLGVYIDAILSRDPFTGGGNNISSVAKIKESKMEELINGYILVGIDRGLHPAALVENKVQQRTLIVGVGDEINGMKVKKITQEGVVLTYDGEETLLR